LTTEVSHAVFLSYASQDAAAARRTCDTLRSAGIEVWLDQSELRGGDAWDQTIRRQIRECALFVPIISANTALRSEGYFRLEWALADERTHMMSRNKTFIVPVCVDATPEAGADVPDSFLRVQWTRLPAGEAPPGFAERVRSLLDPAVPASRADARTPAPPRPAAAVRAGRSGRWYAGVALGVIVVAALAALRPWHLLAARQDAPRQDPSVSEAPQKSVAVLPFADMSEKHDQEYFSDGLSEELIDVLSKIPNLRVPARTSSFSFKGKSATIGEIARALGVTHVLEGSVRTSGDRMRITAQLVRADNGFHLWSQTYDREVRDIFAVQDDIAHEVAEQLKAALLMSARPAELANQTTSVDAHNLYLKARFLMVRDSAPELEQAVDLYQQALKLDPSYAQAWAWLAYTRIRQIAQGGEPDTAENHEQAVAAAKRAIQLNPNLPEGYSSLATANMQFERNWLAALQALDKAATLDPNDPLVNQAKGHLSAAIGAPDEPAKHFRRAVDADPLNMLPRKYLGRALYYQRQPAEAVAGLRRAIELNGQFPGLQYELGRALLQQNQTQAAVAAFEAEPDPVWRQNGLALGYFAAHRLKDAQATLAAFLAHPNGGEFQIAETYAFLGQPDKAFEWLENARLQHDPGIIWMRNDPLLTSISADPRFAAFLKSVNMPAENAHD
jgi:TolB-like protein/Tfp pilus assembly protein PilF